VPLQPLGAGVGSGSSSSSPSMKGDGESDQQTTTESITQNQGQDESSSRISTTPSSSISHKDTNDNSIDDVIRSSLRRHWLSSLKESQFITNGSAGVTSVMEMKDEHAEAMFAAVEDGHWERYVMAMDATGLKSIGPAGSATGAGGGGGSSDNFPVRICMIDCGSGQSSSSSSGNDNHLDRWNSYEYMSAPVSAVQALYKTLRELIIEWGERLGLAEKQQIDTEKYSDDETWYVAGEKQQPRLHAGIIKDRLVQVIICGLEPPLSATLVDCYERLHYPDRFLYLVIRTFSPSE